MPLSKTLINHIKENHHRFHFFFVLIISTAISFGVLYVSLIENLNNTAEAQISDIIFSMNCASSSDINCGWLGNVPVNQHHSRTFLQGGGPNGQNAMRFDMIDSGGYSEFYWGWSGTVESLDLPQGTTRYYRFRLMHTPDTIFNGYNSDGGTGRMINKYLIVGDGCGNDCRVILSSYTIDMTNRFDLQIQIGGGAYPARVSNLVAGVWYDIQLELNSSSSTSNPNGSYKMWVNNNNYSSPSAQISGFQLNPVRWGYLGFGFYSNHVVTSQGRVGMILTDFQAARSFNPNWNNGGTTSTPIPTPTPTPLATPTPAPGSLYFYEGWESGSRAGSFNSQNYGNLQNSPQFSVQNSIRSLGTYGLRHTIAAGQTGGATHYGTQHFGDAVSGPVLVSGQGNSFSDVYAQWRVYYSPGFDFSTRPKQMIIGTEDFRRHDNACCNPWVSNYITIFTSDGGVLDTEGNNKQAANGQWFGLLPNMNGYSASNYFYMQTGRWYVIEVRRRLNDSGVDNGIFQMWVDGQQVANYTNVRYRVPWNGTFGADMGYGTNFIMISDYLNGPAPTQGQDIYYDDVRLSTSYIGFTPPNATPTPSPVIITQPCTITSASWQQAQYTVGDTAVMNVIVSNPANCNTNSLVINIYDEDPFNPDDLIAGPISQQFNQTTNQTTLTYIFNAQDYIDGGNESGNESIYFTAQVQGQSTYVQSSQVNFYNSTTTVPTPTPTPSITIPTPTPIISTPDTVPQAWTGSSIEVVNPISGRIAVLNSMFNVAMRYSYYILGPVIIMMIIFSGLMFMLSRGDLSRLNMAKKALIWALGLLVVLLIGTGFTVLLEDIMN